jgi:hypothetical protein
MESLNFHQGEIIGKNELIHWNSNLREPLHTIIDKLGQGFSAAVGKQGALIKNNPIGDLIDVGLKVSLGTNQVGGYNTIKINEGWGIGYTTSASVDPIVSISEMNGLPLSINSLSRYDPFYKSAEDNISIPGIDSLGIGDVRYVVVHPRITILEDGTCNISTNNQVVFSDSKVVAKLRDQSSNSPSKLKFFSDNSTSYNSGAVYEVVSIINSTTVVISGTFNVSVTGLYCAIVGSYDLQELASLSSSDKYLYSYLKGAVVIDTDAIHAAYGGFCVARLDFLADHSFTITDIRSNYLFSLGGVRNTPWVDIMGYFGEAGEDDFDMPNSTLYIRGVELDELFVPSRFELRGSVCFRSTARIHATISSSDEIPIIGTLPLQSNMEFAISPSDIVVDNWTDNMRILFHTHVSAPNTLLAFAYDISNATYFNATNPYRFQIFLNRI